MHEVEERMAKILDGDDAEIFRILKGFVCRKGKMLRPALCILSANACMAKEREHIIENAAIIELIHNSTLIRDDIEDMAMQRRGVPTLNSAYGLPVAMNSADALYNMAWAWMLDLRMPPERLLGLQRIYAHFLGRAVRGQAMELGWVQQKRLDIGEEEYLSMISDKTSSLIELSCEIGIFLGPSQEDSKKIRSYCASLGIAFQIQDDILNIIGDASAVGKDTGEDIREGKMTLMAIHCLENAGVRERSEFSRILQSKENDEPEISAAIAIMKGTGSVEYAKRVAERFVVRAKESIEKMPDSDEKRGFLKIADYVVARGC
jgi:geranylgeranyl pyrophosphate synthase